MLGTIIFWTLCLVTFSLALGRVLGQLFWTPPGQVIKHRR